MQNKLQEKLGATECESAVEQYQEMCARYYERLDRESRQESKKAMDYIENDKKNIGMKEME